MSTDRPRLLRVLALVGGLLVLGGGVALAVTARQVPVDHHLRTAVVFRQGPAAVWQVATDWQAHAGWRGDVAAVTPVDASTWRLEHEDGGETTLRVLSWTPPRSVTVELTGERLVGTWTLDLVRAGVGTGVVLTERGQVPGTLSRVVAHHSGALGAPARAFLADLAARLGEEAELLTSADEVAALTTPAAP